MRATAQYDTVLRAAGNDSLSLDEMRIRLPAIFAPAAHDSRSERYVYISTEEVVNALVAEGFNPVEARVSRAAAERRAFCKHMVKFRKAGDVKERRVGDVAFEVVLRNAHDGTGSYDFMAGLFRLACLNGMVVSAGNVGSVHVRHTGNRDKQLAKVIDGAYTVLQTAPLALEAPTKWSEIHLSHDAQKTFAESARVIRFGDKHGDVRSPITADQLLVARRTADIGNDLWRTFNRVQENAIRGGLTGRNERHVRQTTREIVGIDNDLKVNRALWLLADNTAKLKLAA